MRQVCLVSKEDKRCANNKPFAHPTLADNGNWKDVTKLVNGKGLVGYEQRLKITNDALDVLRQK